MRPDIRGASDGFFRTVVVIVSEGSDLGLEFDAGQKNPIGHNQEVPFLFGTVPSRQFNPSFAVNGCEFPVFGGVDKIVAVKAPKFNKIQQTSTGMPQTIQHQSLRNFKEYIDFNEAWHLVSGPGGLSFVPFVPVGWGRWLQRVEGTSLI